MGNTLSAGILGPIYDKVFDACYELLELLGSSFMHVLQGPFILGKHLCIM